jgi:16S rRNA (cytosine967-C5)-methyltransferase
MPDGVRLDCPDWLLPLLTESLGERRDAVLEAMRWRAPVILRVNLARADLSTALRRLSDDGITAEPHPAAGTALQVVDGARKIRGSRAFGEGLVELQDAASQAAIEALGPIPEGTRVLDYCAGGGGKALALAAMGANVVAHDADPSRMRDIGPRAARAGARITCVRTPEIEALGPFDLVLVDAPCSGSGTWRRQPEAKWSLTPKRLADLSLLQQEIVYRAAKSVGTAGRLAYATCSILEPENAANVQSFINRVNGFEWVFERRWTPLDGGDGFYLAVLKKHV